MRQRLQIQQPIGTPDGMGGQLLTFQPVMTVWGQVDPATGREQIQADQVSAVATHEIVIRYRPGIVPKMRMVRQGAGSQIFEIQAVLNIDMRNHQLTLLCSEIQATGA